jgi:predicted HicB family RNase H-like nuclease
MPARLYTETARLDLKVEAALKAKAEAHANKAGLSLSQWTQQAWKEKIRREAGKEREP